MHVVLLHLLYVVKDYTLIFRCWLFFVSFFFALCVFFLVLMSSLDVSDPLTLSPHRFIKHALANSRWAFHSTKENDENPLSSFCNKHCNSTADERGRSLLKSEELKFASDVAASAPEAQTNLPARDGPDLDHHFAAFVFAPLSDEGSSGRLLELDGTKKGPIDHGAVDGGVVMFLEKAADTIRQRFMDVDPSSIEFTMMALCKLE
jgi:hypothetical protein